MKTLPLILLFAAITGTAQTQVRKVAYSDGIQKLEGYAVLPDQAEKTKAGVLILPPWKGANTHTDRMANVMAQSGYYAFVADIYGVDKRPKDNAEAAKASGYYKTHYADYQRRIELARKQLVKLGANPDKLVVIGYCFGGTGALEAARGQLPFEGAVCIHGGLKREGERPQENIKTKVLVLHGADDPFVPETDCEAFREEMRQAQADWQMIYYADAVHAFTEREAGDDKSRGAAYNATADRRSFIHLMNFLKETLNN